MTDPEITANAKAIADRLGAEFDGMQFVVVVGDPESQRFAVSGNIPIPNQIGMLGAAIGWNVEQLKKGEQ